MPLNGKHVISALGRNENNFNDFCNGSHDQIADFRHCTFVTLEVNQDPGKPPMNSLPCPGKFLRFWALGMSHFKAHLLVATTSDIPIITLDNSHSHCYASKVEGFLEDRGFSQTMRHKMMTANANATPSCTATAHTLAATAILAATATINTLAATATTNTLAATANALTATTNTRASHHRYRYCQFGFGLILDWLRPSSMQLRYVLTARAAATATATSNAMIPLLQTLCYFKCYVASNALLRQMLCYFKRYATSNAMLLQMLCHFKCYATATASLALALLLIGFGLQASTAEAKAKANANATATATAATTANAVAHANAHALANAYPIA
ncbi:hypothetical protein F5880DRAFT_1730980 [Lentinula raphanica]|nr:hypothetical protein F5880DRAFT_1730980 [Lentinula raphanica]